MGDPFEEAASQSTSPVTHPQGAPQAPANTTQSTVTSTTPPRESFVQQAVNFLNDPRVKASDRSRAVTFLRGKGVTDAEIWEAFQRCGIPYPSNVHPGAMPMHGPTTAIPSMSMAHSGQPHPASVPMPPAEFPTTRRPSWASMLLGLTAAAGLYTAVREVLRQYVVPLYFPEAARAAEEQGRRESEDAASQRKEISELRERVQDLCASSARTSERVEQLSRSISSSLGIRERELSTTAELRDAIQQLSHSVSMSASMGTDTNAFADDSGHPMSAASTRKAGNLAYTATRRFPAVGTIPSYDIARRDMALNKNTPNGESVEKDDFMAIAPAQVEDSWRADVQRSSMTHDSTIKHLFSEEVQDIELNRSTTTTQVTERCVVPPSAVSDEDRHATRRSMSFVHVDDKPNSDNEPVVRNDNDEMQKSEPSRVLVGQPQSDNTDDVIVADAVAVVNGDVSTDVTVEANSEVDDNTGNSSTSGTADDNAVTGEHAAEVSENRVTAARKMFEADVLSEASHLFGEGGIPGTLLKSNRPTSMPSLDLPLSDVDY